MIISLVSLVLAAVAVSALPTDPVNHLQPVVLLQNQPLMAVPVLPTTRTNQEALAAAETSWFRGGQRPSGWKNRGQTPHGSGGYRPGYNYGGGAPHQSGWKKGGHKWG